MSARLDLYQTTGTSPPEGIAPTIQEGEPGNLGVLSLVPDASSERAKRASAPSFRDGLSQSQPEAERKTGCAPSRDGSSSEPLADPAPGSLSSGLPSDHIQDRTFPTPLLVTWVWMGFRDADQYGEYMSIRDELIDAHWRSKSSKRTFGRLAYDDDDLRDEVDLHVREGMLDRDQDVAKRWLRRVVKNRLIDLRRMGKRTCRPATVSLVLDGETDDGDPLVPTDWFDDQRRPRQHYDANAWPNYNPDGWAEAMDAKADAMAKLIELRDSCRGGHDAIAEQLRGADIPDATTRKRISRFYIALAEQQDWTTEQARDYVAELVDLLLSQQ